MKKVVIIGAGQTGRGFIAPILAENGYNITFLDKDEQLVQQLQVEKKYKIEYFGNSRSARIITDFQAFSTHSKEACSALLESSLVIISILANNISSLIPLFQEVTKIREKKLTIICCENGINVKRPLVDSKIDAVISEGIIFCTSLRPDKEKLDLLSQDYPELPIDGQVEGLELAIKGMPLEMSFPELIQRKIYTYNFISAIVAYLGSYKGYEVYGEAANDSTIAQFIKKIQPELSQIVAKEYHVNDEEQLIFTQNAVKKFQNKEIYDTIYRNAREAERKLSNKERLLVPLKLAQKYKIPTGQFELVVASAIYYAFAFEQLSVENYFDFLQNELGDEAMISRIKRLFNAFCQKEELSKIIKSVE